MIYSSLGEKHLSANAWQALVKLWKVQCKLKTHTFSPFWKMLVAVVRHIAYFEGEYSLFQVCIGCFQVSLPVLSVLPAVYIFYSNFLQNTSLLWPGVTFSDVLFLFQTSTPMDTSLVLFIIPHVSWLESLFPCWVWPMRTSEAWKVL